MSSRQYYSTIFTGRFNLVPTGTINQIECLVPVSIITKAKPDRLASNQSPCRAPYPVALVIRFQIQMPATPFAQHLPLRQYGRQCFQTGQLSLERQPEPGQYMRQ